jgi:hypothetical protein
MSRQLLSEERRAPVKVLESDAQGVFRFEAVVSEADHLNQNRRVYPEAILFPAFQAYNNALIAGYADPGLVDHPGIFDGGPSVSDIGIKWENFRTEGKLVIGVGVVVPTRAGLDMQQVMLAGVPVGFSTRGYGEQEEITAEDGKPANRMTAYELETVDAVVSPSVKHARVRSYRQEETEQMEKELLEAKAALEAAQARIAGLEGITVERDELLAKLEEANSALEAAQARIAELETAAAELETLKADAEALRAENELTAKLNELTEGHRFAPTIISEARELGVTLENVEKVVARLMPLVEAAGSKANEGGEPRGDVSHTGEEEDSEPSVSVKYTAEQLADLRGAHFISETEYQELLAQLS